MKKYHVQGSGAKVGEWVVCKANKCRLGDTSHKTEFELHRMYNHERVEASLKTTDDMEKTSEEMRVLAALDLTYTPLTSYGVLSAMKDIEADTAEAAEIAASGDKEQMEAFLERRINSDDFTTLLTKRDETQALLEKIREDRDVLKKRWETDPDFYYEDVRQKELAMIDINEELTIIRRQVNAYKDVNGPVVAALGELEEQELREQGLWREYDEETLNKLEKTAEFDSGTREWLEQRQGGIGGSDVGPILRVKGAYNSRDDIMRSKLDPITDEQVAEQTSSEIAGAAARGNAWEKHILMKVRDNNPDLNVAYCKSSWQSTENAFQFANFDGLLTDENGVPNGIVEIKTASVAGKWGNPEDGLDGVPATYRTQTLWYAQAAGFKRGIVAVLIDDREYREYHFEMTPELEEEANRNLEAVRTFTEELESRKNGTWTDRARPRGFSKDALNSSPRNAAKQEIFNEVATMRGVYVRDVEREFMRGIDRTKLSDRTYVANRLRDLYVNTAKQESLPNFVGIDLETAGAQPTSGAIIEFGASVRSNYAQSDLISGDTESGKVSKLYGLSRKNLLARGTGNSEVHGITEGKVAKKRQFLNPQEGDSVLRLLVRNRIMLAHNASFEDRWLKTHVAGYADAVKRKRIRVLDSMKLSRRLLADAPNDKLESFTERYKIPYTGAHRAYRDSEMMCYGYERLLRELRTGKVDL